MVYNSYFDKLGGKLVFSHSNGDVLCCDKSLDYVFKDLFQGLENSVSLDIILNSSRILRALMDYKIEIVEEGLSETKIVSELQNGINLVQKIYTGDTGVTYDLMKFQSNLVDCFGKNILERRISQKEDGTSWQAYNPVYSNCTLNEMKYVLRGSSNLVFVALGHGGVPVGLDIYLRYLDFYNCDNSHFYSARFSRNKIGDSKPRVSEIEIDYLSSLTKGRQFVLFDEDMTTGSSMREAINFFQDKLQLNQVFSFTNRDLRYLNPKTTYKS